MLNICAKVFLNGWPLVRAASRRQSVRALEERLEATSRELEKTREQLQWELSVSTAIRDLSKPFISVNTSVAKMAVAVLERARNLTGSSEGYVSVIDPITGEDVGHSSQSVLASDCRVQEPAPSLRKGPDGKYSGLWGHALNTGKPFFANSPESHPAANGFPPGHIPIHRILCVPVMLDGQPAGQIAVANSARDYDYRDVKAVRRLARFYALAVQQKQSQVRTATSLREKEVLLREIHHRVKNNLQVICSLLNLQAGLSKDEHVLEMLNDSRNRVRSMALVHEQLHRAKDLSKIHFGDYVRNLVASLVSAYGIASRKITIRVEGDEVFVGIDTATHLGLIVHELVSNAFRHAFPGMRTGEVRIGLDTVPGGGIRLRIVDDGIGGPSTLNIMESKSLGLRLVRILAEQMDATVEYETVKGTRFSMTIPRS